MRVLFFLFRNYDNLSHICVNVEPIQFAFNLAWWIAISFCRFLNWVLNCYSSLIRQSFLLSSFTTSWLHAIGDSNVMLMSTLIFLIDWIRKALAILILKNQNSFLIVILDSVHNCSLTIELSSLLNIHVSIVFDYIRLEGPNVKLKSWIIAQMCLVPKVPKLMLLFKGPTIYIIVYIMRSERIF